MSKSLILYDGIEADWPFHEISGLQDYLDEVWQKRPLFLFEDDNEEERRSTKQRFFNFSENKIGPRNYVGFIQFGDLRLNVYPRVFYNHPVIQIERDPSLAIQHVLKWLSYGNRIHFPFSETENTLKQQSDWLEALIFLFANYTSEILTSSPYFAYQEIEEEMSYIRGRIEMKPYINRNLAKGRQHLLNCTYEPFLYDNQFNRIVKHTCRLLQSATANSYNRLLLNDIIFLLDEVTDTYCTSEDCSKVKANRLYQEVGLITNMCAAFLNNQAFNDGKINNQNLCILLPMEVIYEQYVAGFIKKHFREFNAVSQARSEYLAQTGKDFKNPVFQMRHDILMPEMIIDTKYKFRERKKDLKSGVSQGDLYQIVAYCYKRKKNNGMLLYPFHFYAGAENEMKEFKIENIIIKACSIDITEVDLKNFEDKQVQKIIQLF